ncbi:hypothetical protein ACE6H2_015745 [Prunus campanulata]
MIEKKYTIAKFTRQGYIELLEALSKEEHGLCVFYWNGCFNTMCKIKLFLKSSIRQPEISVAVVSLDELDLTCLKDAMLCGKLKDEMQPFQMEMAALVWPGDVPEDEFDSLVVTDRYIGVDDENEGVMLVRSDCMEEPDEFADVFGALIKQAMWNRVVWGGRMLNT